MYCPHCGNNIGDSTFCPNCGKNITNQIQDPSPQEPVTVIVKKKSFGKYILIGIALLILFGFLKSQWNAYKEKSKMIADSNKTVTNIESAKEKVSVGDIVSFGKYYKDNKDEKLPIEWRVLSTDGNKLLVISEYGLDCQQYNTSNTEVTWETCSLRSWLNDSFYKAAFNKEEQKKILLTDVKADRNPEYTTRPGNDTQDKIFVLSAEEANTFFASDDERKCIPTKYSEDLGAVISKRYEKDGEATCDWWLRTPGLDQQVSCLVFSTGSIYEWGYYVSKDNICVRPVMWVKYGVNDNNSSVNSYEQKTKEKTQTNSEQVKKDDLEVFTATIDLTDVNLEIESTNKDKLYYDYNGDEKADLKVIQNNNLININQYESNEKVTSSKVLKIYVPKKYKLSINAKTQSGDINVNFSTISYLRLGSMSGDLTVISDDLNESSIDTMSGDVNVVSKTIGTIAAKSMSGDVDVSGEISGTYSASTISGQAVVNGKVVQN